MLPFFPNIFRTWICALITVSALIGACSGDRKPEAAPPAPVRVAIVERGNMTHKLEAVGNVQPSASVSITPRVDGEIVAVNFTEGQEIKAGESILEIDPRPYAATIAEKRANLAKSRAQLRKAQRDRARYGKLVRDGYISQQAYDQTETDAESLHATVEADIAALKRAELDLSYCSILSPITGRIGELKMHKGNMVKNNDTGSVCTIDTIAPCHVFFSVPEAHLPAILDHSGKGSVIVTATPIGGVAEEGKLTLVDNSVDMKTGSIRLRATFENTQGRLWPGQFVEIRLPLEDYQNELIVPTQAIQTGRGESFVYVVDREGKADYRKVHRLLEQNGKSVVRGPLYPGEQVVIEGQVRLAPGSPTHILN